MTLIIAYDGEVGLWVKLLFIKIRLVPARKKRYRRSMSARKAARLKKKRIKKLRKKLEKKRDKEEEKQSAKKAADKSQEKKKTPAEILDIIHLVCKLVTKVVGKFFKHLRIKLARINIKIATEDAATTAITYGAVTQAINVLFPLLDNIRTFKFPQNRDINIYADFCSDEAEIDIRIDFAIRVWHVLHVAIVALVQLVKYFFNAQKRKEQREIIENKIAERQASANKKGQTTKRS
jgi:hypothetical protein